MLRVILSIAIFFSICLNMSVFAKEEEPVLSTSGLETGEVTINTKPDKAQQQDWKLKRKQNKLYFKTKKAIEKREYKRNKLEKEAQYLQKRLEAKKQKLEILNPATVKGEEE